MSEEKIGFKSILNKILIIIIAILLLVIISVGGYLIINDNTKLSDIYIKQVLEESSELTTAKLNITGMHTYKDEGFTLLNKSNFTMVYKATVRIGIDLRDIKVKVDNDKKIVMLSIPYTSVIEANVDNSSIKYFDEKFALFNLDPKEDSNKSIKEAKKKAEIEAGNTGVLTFADKQAEAIVKGLLLNVIPDDYKVEVERFEAEK